MLRIEGAPDDRLGGQFKFEPPLSTVPLSETAMKRTGLLEGAAVVSFSLLAGGRWHYDVIKISENRPWWHAGPIHLPVELWVASGSAVVSTYDGTHTVGSGTRASLSCLERVLVSVSGSAGGEKGATADVVPGQKHRVMRRASSFTERLSPVQEMEKDEVLSNSARQVHSVHDGCFFAWNVRDGRGRAPNERVLCRTHCADA